MELSAFMSECISQIRNIVNSEDQIRYCVKLFNVTTYKENTSATSRFANMVSGIGSLVSDTISSVVYNSYLVGLENGSICFISEKLNHIFFNPTKVMVNMAVDAGAIQFTFYCSLGALRGGVINLSPDTLENTVWGNLAEVFKDFDTQQRICLSGLSDRYVRTRISRPSLNPDKPYALESFCIASTLISYDDNSIYLHNQNKSIPFNQILLCNCTPERYLFLVKEQDVVSIYEIFRNSDCIMQNLEFNLLTDSTENTVSEIEIDFPEQILHPNQFLSVCGLKDFIMIAADNMLLFPTPTGLMEGGLFNINSTVYVKLKNGAVSEHPNLQPIINMLPLLPDRYDSIFLVENESQPCLSSGEIKSILVRETGIEFDNQFYSFEQMRNFRYTSESYNCRIEFEYEDNRISFLTANSLGIRISSMQEHFFIKIETMDFTLDQLYDYNIRNQSRNFIAGTFSELLKTDAMLNFYHTVDSILDEMEDSAVLRNALQGVVGKFADIDDLQSNLLQKLALLEVQRRGIQKMMDEWILFYPHYAASKQVEWLKDIFSPYVSAETLETEYWRCVSHFKRILSAPSAYVQKTLGEIALCTNRLLPLLPDEVKRVNVPRMLRISSRSGVQLARAGADTMAAVTTGTAITKFIIRGFSAVDPMMMILSMNVKMMINSYAEDVNQRKDIKAFGQQALEWWQILIKCISVHIMELSREFNTYYQTCIDRDKAIFRTIPEDKAEAVRKKLTDALKGQITQGVNEKYLEIAPQLNLRFANILNDIDVHLGACGDIVKEFNENIII